MLEWIEGEAVAIRFGKDGIYQVWPPGGLIAACFRRYEARSVMPLLHDHLLLSVNAQRLDGKWGLRPLGGAVREHGGRARALQRDRDGTGA
ncbi:hypothetical protein GCM10009566_43620 [Streptomyces murinus]|uniref:relaxase domain-containing protein n=1 Tax=Streptomyces murinus TaxID=33900 RepID=UPI001602BDB1